MRFDGRSACRRSSMVVRGRPSAVEDLARPHATWARAVLGRGLVSSLEARQIGQRSRPCPGTPVFVARICSRGGRRSVGERKPQLGLRLGEVAAARCCTQPSRDRATARSRWRAVFSGSALDQRVVQVGAPRGASLPASSRPTRTRPGSARGCPARWPAVPVRCTSSSTATRRVSVQSCSISSWAPSAASEVGVLQVEVGEPAERIGKFDLRARPGVLHRLVRLGRERRARSWSPASTNSAGLVDRGSVRRTTRAAIRRRPPGPRPAPRGSVRRTSRATRVSEAAR